MSIGRSQFASLFIPNETLMSTVHPIRSRVRKHTSNNPVAHVLLLVQYLYYDRPKRNRIREEISITDKWQLCM